MAEIALPKNSAVKVLAVSSGKGGVGKTNISVNMALGLAKAGKTVMLMDADLGLANVDIMLGIKPEFNLHDVISGNKTLLEIIIDGPGGIKLIPAASGIGRMAELSATEHAALIKSFSDLEMHIDYLIVDIAAGISDSVISFCRASQEIVVIVCDEPTSITDAYALIKVMHNEHKINNFQILCNRVHDAKHGRKLYATLANVAEGFLDVSLGYLGSIPEDSKILEAVRKQQPLLSCFPYSPAGVAFKSLVENVERLPSRESSGNLEFFIERVVGNQRPIGFQTP